ncbi:MAG: hypothetical protein LC659_02535 [Myxococcales bacterium]|nr:hypothetical protein [Myxococcales bacterium]
MTQKKWLGALIVVLGAAACSTGGGSSSSSSQSLGEKCAVDADCKATESCIANVCAPKLPPAVGDLGVAMCKVTSDCATGDICAHGVCLPQHLGGVDFCDKDADCTAGDQCLAQVCVPKLPSGGNGGGGLPFDLGALTGVGQMCTQSSDCTGGLDCAFGVCLPVHSCKSDSDCTAPTATCETHVGICI